MSRLGTLALVLIALSLLTAGCDLPFISNVNGSGQALTPEDAARQAHLRANTSASSSGTQPGQNFKLLGTRVWGNRAFVLSMDYGWAPTTQGPSNQSFYDDFVIRDATGWESFSSEPDLVSAPLTPPALVCPGVQIGNDNLGDFTTVYGRARLPDVAGIEVKFSSGQVVTDTTNDGIFAVMVPRLDVPYDLRVLDSKGQMLHSVNLSSTLTLPPIKPGESRGMGPSCTP